MAEYAPGSKRVFLSMKDGSWQHYDYNIYLVIMPQKNKSLPKQGSIFFQKNNIDLKLIIHSSNYQYLIIYDINKWSVSCV